LTEPENAESITAAIETLAAAGAAELQAIGARSQDFYARELSVRAGVDRFAWVFRDLVALKNGKKSGPQSGRGL